MPGVCYRNKKVNEVILRLDILKFIIYKFDIEQNIKNHFPLR